MDSSTLENYISRYGWTYERYDEVVVSGLETVNGNCLIAFQLSPPWLRLSVPVYAPGKDGPAEFYADLLRLNHGSRMARFALDDDGHVTICIDLHTDPELNYAQFELALDVLGYIAESSMPYVVGLEDEDVADDNAEVASETEEKPS